MADLTDAELIEAAMSEDSTVQLKATLLARLEAADRELDAERARAEAAEKERDEARHRLSHLKRFAEESQGYAWGCPDGSCPHATREECEVAMAEQLREVAADAERALGTSDFSDLDSVECSLRSVVKHRDRLLDRNKGLRARAEKAEARVAELESGIREVELGGPYVVTPKGAAAARRLVAMVGPPPPAGGESGEVEA